MKCAAGLEGKATVKKRITGLVLGLVVVLAMIFALQMVASETGEVVVLRVAHGSEVEETRLWVVDVAGEQFLRAGHEGAGWFSGAVGAERVEVERNGVSANYRVVPAPEMRAQVARAMLDKYGWRERYISLLVGGRDGAVPLRLVTSP